MQAFVMQAKKPQPHSCRRCNELKVAFRHTGWKPHVSAFRSGSITEWRSYLSVFIEPWSPQLPADVAFTFEFLRRYNVLVILPSASCFP